MFKAVFSKATVDFRTSALYCSSWLGGSNSTPNWFTHSIKSKIIWSDRSGCTSNASTAVLRGRDLAFALAADLGVAFALATPAAALALGAALALEALGAALALAALRAALGLRSFPASAPGSSTAAGAGSVAGVVLRALLLFLARVSTGTSELPALRIFLLRPLGTAVDDSPLLDLPLLGFPLGFLLPPLDFLPLDFFPFPRVPFLVDLKFNWSSLVT